VATQQREKSRQSGIKMGQVKANQYSATTVLD